MFQTLPIQTVRHFPVACYAIVREAYIFFCAKSLFCARLLRLRLPFRVQVELCMAELSAEGKIGLKVDSVATGLKVASRPRIAAPLVICQ